MLVLCDSVTTHLNNSPQRRVERRNQPISQAMLFDNAVRYRPAFHDIPSRSWLAVVLHEQLDGVMVATDRSLPKALTLSNNPGA